METKDFYFDNWRGRNYVTLKKASPEWVNSDCPSVFTKDHREILHNGGLNGWYGLPVGDMPLLKHLRNFVKNSDIAFCKKYASLGHAPGNIVKNIDRELPDDILQAMT